MELIDINNKDIEDIICDKCKFSLIDVVYDGKYIIRNKKIVFCDTIENDKRYKPLQKGEIVYPIMYDYMGNYDTGGIWKEQYSCNCGTQFVLDDGG